MALRLSEGSHEPADGPSAARYIIGGWTAEEFDDPREIDPENRLKIDRVLAGEIHENGAGVRLPPRMQLAITNVLESNVLQAGQALAQGGLPQAVVIASLEEMKSADRPREEIEEIYRRVIQSICHYIRGAVDEAIINEVKHGHRYDFRRPVEITACVKGDRLHPVLHINHRNENERGFDPASVPDPTDPENLLKFSGRGLLMMRAFMDSVAFGDKGFSGMPGSSLTMTKKLYEFSEAALQKTLTGVLSVMKKEGEQAAKAKEARLPTSPSS